MFFHLLPFILALLTSTGPNEEARPQEACLPNGIILNNQSQIDAFPGLYPGCDSIEGNVFINGAVSNLDSLKGLRAIGGSLFIYATSLKNFSGLEGLRSVGGELSVFSNFHLISFSGLDSLKELGSRLSIYQNDSLSDILGLSGLLDLKNNPLRISFCPRLSTCLIPAVCGHLASGGSAVIHDNAPGCNSRFQIAKACDPGALCPSVNIEIHGQEDLNDFISLYPECEDIAGSLNLISVEDTFYSLLPLAGIRTIGNVLNIVSNPFLSDLKGLDSLLSVANGLTIHSNPRLKNLDGLGSLQWVGNTFQLVLNDSLSSLEGLGQIDPDSLHTLYFQFCPLLSACDHASICQFLSGGGLAYLDGNAQDCNTSHRIQKHCYPDSLCPPGNLYFRTQEEVNDFHILYPNCQDLAGNLSIDGRNINRLDSLFGLKSVAGQFYLSNNDSLEHLNGLSGLQSIGQNFYILLNPALLSLAGLESLRQIGVGLVMDNNPLLQDLSALADSLLGTNPDFYLRIFYNPALALCHVPAICNYVNQGGEADIEGNAPGCTSLNEIILNCNPSQDCPPGNIEIRSQADLDFFTLNYPDCDHIAGSLTINSEQGPVTSLASLSHLKSIGGSFYIENNPALASLSGLDSLEFVGEALSIGSNAGLQSLEGLESLRIIGDYLAIYLNDALLRLEGLENLNPDSLDYLYVYECSQLSECNLPGFCSFLIEGGIAVIRDNAPGCDNPFQVIKSCQPGEICPPGHQAIYNQQQLDEWVAAYPDCTDLPGSLQIGPAEEEDPILSLTGLAKLGTIGGTLEINQNRWLKSLQGLDSLQGVGADLRIYSMDSLENLLPLKSLKLIEGQLYIRDNPVLTSLDGLDQFDADKLDALFIWYNEQLSFCSNPAVCAYLSTGKSAVLSENAPGCSSLNEVRPGCGVSCSQDFFEFYSQDEIDAFPANNPGCQNIAGYVFISGSDITNLDSLRQIKSIGQDITIFSNPVLNDISGLMNLTSVGSYVDISFNPSLTTLDGLSGLRSIGGYLGIYSNNILDNIDALYQVDHKGIQEFYLQFNPRLQACNVEVVCAFLSDETKSGLAFINDNKPGCNNPSEVKTNCGLANCPEGNLTLGSQAEVDGFRSTYGDCAALPGDLIINGTDIVNLDSLSNLYQIGGQLIIENTGLENLHGLDHILYTTISHLSIRNNPSLAVCDVRAICDFLSLSGGTFEIIGNAQGCATESEVRYSCSKTCFWDGVSFTSQAQVDSFRRLYGNCEVIPHAVTISGSGINRLDSLFNLKKIGRGLTVLSTSVPDLDGLAGLDSVGGSLDIRSNSQLLNISQLQNIRSIGSTLRIQSNAKLTSLAGLGRLSGVPFNLTVQSNSALASLSGLDSIGYVGNTLLVMNNPQLNSFSGLRSLKTVGLDCRLETNNLVMNFQGLEKLESVGNDLRILNNTGLQTTVGLSGLKTIGRHLRIENNGGLDSLSGLSALESIGSTFQLINNASLNHIHDLSSLRHIGQSLIIRNNSLLSSLNGLDQVEADPLDYLSIENNPFLDLCNVRSVCLYLFDPDKTYSIFGNAISCQTGDQILASCSIALPVSLISFTASLEQGQALLQWNTTGDLRPDLFMIEHSRDGERFSLLDKMPFGHQSHPYTYRHSPPPGMNYYRVKAVAEGRSSVYSSIGSVQIKNENWVLPNPTRGILHIRPPDEQRCRIEVRDLTGRVLMNVAGQGPQIMDLSGQPSGIYLISVLSYSGRRIFKVLKE